MHYTIVDQQADFLLVDKAPGVVVLGEEDSLLRALRTDLALPDLHPVHRLDRGTSGLTLFAKTSAANKQLAMAFEQRRVNKYYLVLIDGKPKKKQGLISGDMAKARNGSYKLLRSQDNPARTSFFSFALTGGRRLVVARIYTGKTHQIRVALSALGTPAIGDRRYGGSSADRLYLHAAQLQFELDGQVYDYFCPPTMGEAFRQQDFVERLQGLGQPAALSWPRI